MVSDLARLARDSAEIPLCWAGASGPGEPLNLGDALSPVMVALLSGKPVRRVPFRSENPRLVAVGTVGQNVSGGAAWFWGTGCDARCDDEGEGRRRFSPDPATRRHLCATRGPLSAARLGGGRLAARVFGDPVWLLPRFHAPRIEKRWDLGVILHLTELAEKTGDCRPRPVLRRYDVPAEFSGSVRLINTVTGREPTDLGARIDEILACRRILSTSLHGLVYAESYGIPCLYFPVPSGPDGAEGPGRAALAADGWVDHRMTDLYLGAGRAHLDYFAQPAARPTDWAAAMAAIDAAWTPLAPDLDPLVSAFPLDLAPLAARDGETVWEHPVIAGLDLGQGGADLRVADRAAGRAAAREERVAERNWAQSLRDWRVPATVAAEAPPPLRLRRRPGAAAALPLAWAGGDGRSPWVNLGDALSPVIVAAIAGVPIQRVPFKRDEERLAAVGTVAQGLQGGTGHLWGCGLDAKLNAAAPGEPYAVPPRTTLRVHALRGPNTADVLRRCGVPAPEIFGDPVYLIDRVFPMDDIEKTHDLGVIVHLSELEPVAPRLTDPLAHALRETLRDAGLPRLARPRPRRVRADYLRYAVPKPFRERVRIITMNVERSFVAMRMRLREIASCRAILSTSLHGLVLADVYGVPNAWFGFGEGGFAQVDPLDPAQDLDHRMRDLYAGQGRARVPVVQTRRDRPSDWDRLIGLSERFAAHRPDCRALFDAFPGPRAVRWDEARWPVPRGLIDGFR